MNNKPETDFITPEPEFQCEQPPDADGKTPETEDGANEGADQKQDSPEGKPATGNGDREPVNDNNDEDEKPPDDAQEPVQDPINDGDGQTPADAQVQENDDRTKTETPVDRQSRIAMAKRFFDLLFGNITGKYYGYLWTVAQNNRRTTHPFLVTDADQRALMAKRAIELSDDGLTVYFGVNLAVQKPSSYERFTNEKKLKKNQDGSTRETIPVAIQTAVICDVDIEGGTHKQSDGKIYAPDLDTAKSFLPFTPSIIVNSGYGLHAYLIFVEPLSITDENRQVANRRNVNFISVIRARAGDCNKTTDSVGDLARVLRVPGTFNYKQGISDDAPLCRIVEVNDVRFSPVELSSKLEELLPKQPDSPELEIPATTKKKSGQTPQIEDEPEYDLWRAERMLDVLKHVDHTQLTYTQWLAIQSACKAIGVPYSVVDDFNSSPGNGGNYDAEKNQKRWDGLPTAGYSIETLHGIAKCFGYIEDDAWHEWHDKHPKARRRHPTARQQFAEDEITPNADIIAKIRDACEWRYTKDTNGKLKRTSIKPTYSNLQLIFDNDPNLQKLFGFDEFQGSIVFLRRPSWKKDNFSGDEWTDRDDAQLRLYLRQNYGELSNRELIQDYVVKVAQANAFNSVTDFFAKLPKWDGTPRAETLFIKFLRVDDTPFAREVTLNWLLAAIARVFHPGCRYQTALVLHGNQKIGKSYIVERLGGAWYMELTDNVEDSHASDAIQKGWIVELKEMAAMRKAELNAVKAFIERSSETRRRAYERHPNTVYRHNVFVITVNDSEFLRDTTGNRRYLILHCNSPMFGYVPGLTDEYILQVWAEVFQKFNELFKDGFDEKKLELSRDAQFKAEEIATHYLQDDGLPTEIKGYLDTPIPPQIVWLQLTKEERRKFIAEGRIKFFDDGAGLEHRIKARKGKQATEDISALYAALHNPEVAKREGGSEITIYGVERRTHVCMTEIFNEAFGNDNRKRTYRITEILSALEGWHLGARLRHADPQYPDQRKPYYRDEDYTPTNNPVPQNSAKQTAEGEETKSIPCPPTDDLHGEFINPLEEPPF